MAGRAFVIRSFDTKKDRDATELDFDDARARTYRKRAEVMAFRSGDAVTYHKSWGEQAMRPGSWVIVPLDEGGRPHDDVYGCDTRAFSTTYAPSPSGKPHHYVKTATVRAYQPGHAFAVCTVLTDDDGGEHVETDRNTGGPTHWVVQNPGGEVYTVADEVFSDTYEPVPAADAGSPHEGRD